MFEIFGYIISIIIIAFIVTILTEYTKRFKFIEGAVKFFTEKVKKVSWYQVESILIALIILIIFNLLNIISLGTFAVILNAIVIGFLSNGIFTYQFVKDLLLKLKITAKIIELIETKKTVAKKSTKK